MTEFLNVLSLDPSDSVVRAFALALPVAIFITLLALLIVMAKRKSKSRRLGVQQSRSAEPQQAANATPVFDAQSSAASQSAAGVDARETAHVSLVRTEALARTETVARSEALARTEPQTRAEPADIAAPHAAPAATAPAPVPHPTPKSDGGSTAPGSAIAAVEAQIRAATEADQKNSLSPLYLQLAVAHRAAGDDAACLNALRSAAGFGSLHGPRGAHAIARLELGEIAMNAGDPIGACEQWQIARLAFHEDGQTDAFNRVCKRMRENGCPTDWVLTDF